MSLNPTKCVREMEKRNENISGFSLLPEGCISTILSFTSPKDACRCSILSPAFKAAAESDTVWERFLPSDYDDIIARSASPLMSFTSKRQLYFHLCDHPILLDGGKLCFNLSKTTGKKSYMICARELGITWGDNPHKCKWISIPESRFTEMAELLGVHRLEIRGKIQAQILSLKTVYAAYLVFGYTERNLGLDHPSKALIRISRDDESGIGLNEAVAEARVVYLKAPRKGSRTRWVQQGPDDSYARGRMDGWMEIKLGEFSSNQEDDMSTVEMVFWETDGNNLKHGLIVAGIELRPLEKHNM